MTSTDDRPLRRDAQLNRDRIIRAAQEVFAQRGLAGTFHNVADQAGVGLGTVYRRFATKELLVEAVYEQRLADFVGTVEAALHAPTGWDGLVDVLSTAARLHATDRGLRDVVLTRGHRPRSFAAFTDRMEPLLNQLVDRARTEGSLRADVTAEDLPILLALISEVAMHGDPVRPGIHARYLQLLLDGLRRSPTAGALGEPLARRELDAIADSWLPRLDHT
ncbi:TetR/AcrR family transcriptional regulator [Actinoplanes couchii]|uniref:TetR family transcriptional regulator n=1 Tax=Actinoplanes couchii TaxID=403638 RepID=A0ABQ3XL55_9ACTN|nr:TetR/AcrR family transcriptional regulator [Actinoplanes couchii]MDR6318397.1 AcrR family transcriptional regulator [Actinoplanes couchii]GID59237.1 TetR family transcriptional regulator [Actinoplanes couchii]